VLDRAGIKAGACEVLFKGADCGRVPARTETIQFERSLSLDQARNSEILLAYAMNGEPLPIQHGLPLRVTVPSWYAVASVKWLTEIELIDKPFAGHYQVDTYFYEWQHDGKTIREPVTLQRVRSLIMKPEADQEIERGELAIRGVAWSGSAPIARVEVSIDDNPWRQARFVVSRIGIPGSAGS
jgi:DMSO/TMAO reductase YedYZ molybdopterin-dependent catalytic subunit